MRHTHRWTPVGNPTRFYQCHCGKTQKRQPVDRRDVAARRKAGEVARLDKAAPTKSQLRKAITELELARDLGLAPHTRWSIIDVMELAGLKQEWERRYGKEWRGA